MADERENASVSRVKDDSKNQKDDSKESKGKKSGDEKSEDEEKKKSGPVGKKLEQEKQKLELMKKLQKAQMAAQVAGTGVRFALMAKLMSTLKMLLQMASILAQSVAQMGFSAFVSMCLQGIAQAIGNMLSAAGAWFAATFGVSATTAATIVVGAMVGGLAGVIVAIAAVFDAFGGSSTRDDYVEDCNTDAAFMQSAYAATMEETQAAKTIYAILKAWGLPDTNIAGVLGNFSCESGIDPTGVETIMSEPRIIPVEGTKKYEAWMGEYDMPYLNAGGGIDWVTNSPADFMLSSTDTVSGLHYGLRTYAGSLISPSYWKDYSDKYPAIHYMGIGLGQWTNGRNLKLRSYADAHEGYEWYDLELQLIFMLDKTNGDNASNVNFLMQWQEEPTPADAAETFCTKWEGIACADIRKTRAEEWYVQMSTWQEGVDYDLTAAQSLLGAIMSAGSAGSDFVGSAALRSCSGYTLLPNDSAAACAVAYAWGPGDAYDNDGTACWQHIFGSIIGDSWYRCCDRTVCAAIRWSGTDSEYPVGGTSVQLTYLMSSPRWQKVDWGGDKSKLLPGDVLIRNDGVTLGNPDGVGHTLMYVGEDAIVARFGEEYNGNNVRAEGYCLVSGSKGTYSPHVQRFTTIGSGSDNLTTYFVYRNVERYSDNEAWTSLTCLSGTPADGAVGNLNSRPA